MATEHDGKREEEGQATREKSPNEKPGGMRNEDEMNWKEGRGKREAGSGKREAGVWRREAGDGEREVGSGKWEKGMRDSKGV